MPKIGWVKIAVAACVVISGAIVGAPSALASPAGSTVTTVSSSVNPSVVGQTVMFTATVIGSGATGTPTGTVTFSDDGTPIASAVTLQPNGTATVSISSLQAGDQDVTASYSGDTNFGPSEGGLTQVVQQAASTITVSSSPNPSVVGQDVTFTATVTVNPPGPVPPTGTVTFSDNHIQIGTSILDGIGTATLITSSLLAGSQEITATYSGDSNFDGSSAGPVPLGVNPVASTTTTVSSSDNPSVAGQSVTFTATVTVNAPGTGTPTGTVTFSGDGTAVEPLQPDGTATFVSAPLSAGSQDIYASYTAAQEFNPSTSTALTQVVNPAAALCTPGSYSTTGSAPCTPAPAGSFDAGSGNTAATLCPAGTMSPAGATACTANTELAYTGIDQIAIGSSFTPTASLTSPAASCESGQPVSFSLSVDPLTGTAGAYNLGPATSSSAAGAVTGTAVSTSGWENGVYAITASYAGATLGATICAPAMTTASLAVTSPGQLAIGSGLYTVPGAGTASFGFAVALARRSSSTYVGQLNVVTAGKWWFQGDVTSYGKTGSTHGLLAGTGSLYSWNSTLDRGRGGWQLVKTGVTCTATANAGTKATPSSFGIDIAYSPKSGQPALPNSSPITLTRGGIFIS